MMRLGLTTLEIRGVDRYPGELVMALPSVTLLGVLSSGASWMVGEGSTGTSYSRDFLGVVVWFGLFCPGGDEVSAF